MILKKIAPGALFVFATACAVDTERADVGSDARADEVSATTDSRPVILFLGTSLTAGFGLSEDLAYPALIQRRLDSLELGFRVVNAGVSGETSAGGLRRVDWLLQMPVEILVVELGANDGLRGQSVEAMKSNLLEIVARARRAHAGVRIVVAGMEAPPNLGRVYTDSFRAVFQQVASETGAALIPFLLQGVAGVDSLNQPDGIHPTVRGQEIVADNVWRTLRGVLQ